MIWNDEQFAKESIVFFKKIGSYLGGGYPFDIESDAYDYVRKSKDFKYKDHVEAGVLVQFLEQFGYIQFLKKEGSNRFHTLTEKGADFLKLNIK